MERTFILEINGDETVVTITKEEWERHKDEYPNIDFYVAEREIGIGGDFTEVTVCEIT